MLPHSWDVVRSSSLGAYIEGQDIILDRRSVFKLQPVFGTHHSLDTLLNVVSIAPLGKGLHLYLNVLVFVKPFANHTVVSLKFTLTYLKQNLAAYQSNMTSGLR